MNKSSMLKKFLFKRISSKSSKYTEVLGEKHTWNESKRKKSDIFSPLDEILQRSERKRKVVHQKYDKNKAIILR